MRQVDIIRPSSINAINGPIGTLKRILNNQAFFNEHGYEVTLFANESLKQGPFVSVPVSPNSGAKKSKIGLRNIISTWLRFRARTDLWAAKLIYNKSCKETERLIDYYLSLHRTPDIIQFHSDADCYLFLKKCQGPLPKVVLFQHTDGIPLRMLVESLPGLKDSKYLSKLHKQFAWTIKQADRLVFIAKIGQTNFLSYFPEKNPTDTSVIVNGIDELSEQQKKDVDHLKSSFVSPKYRLCCTGTISFRKGQRIVIEAISKLPENLRNQIRVDFIGDGAERDSLEQLSMELGLTKQMRFLGSVPNPEVYKRLAENNIYILMSNNEGLPISIIEAMRVGLPIISTKVSGIPELVQEGYNGFLLNPDVDELTLLLLKLPQYDWEQMGQHSLERFEKEFTFERMKREFCEMYDSTILK